MSVTKVSQKVQSNLATLDWETVNIEILVKICRRNYAVYYGRYFSGECSKQIKHLL